MKRRARRWERDHKALLDIERKKYQEQKDAVNEQRKFMEKSERKQGRAHLMKVREYPSSDEETVGGRGGVLYI